MIFFVDLLIQNFSGSTSFILARIRDCLSHFEASTEGSTSTSFSVTLATINSTATLQAEVISVSQMEDPQEDKIVVVGDVPVLITRPSILSTEAPSTESPMIINTPAPTFSLTLLDLTTTLESVTAESLNSTTPKAVSWQDDIPKGSVFNRGEGQENMSSTADASNSTMTAETMSSSSTEASTTPTTEPTTGIPSTTPAAITTAGGLLIRRRIPQIKPIVSGGLS